MFFVKTVARRRLPITNTNSPESKPHAQYRSSLLHFFASFHSSQQSLSHTCHYQNGTLRASSHSSHSPTLFASSTPFPSPSAPCFFSLFSLTLQHSSLPERHAPAPLFCSSAPLLLASSHSSHSPLFTLRSPLFTIRKERSPSARCFLSLLSHYQKTLLFRFSLPSLHTLPSLIYLLLTLLIMDQGHLGGPRHGDRSSPCSCWGKSTLARRSGRGGSCQR